MVYLGPDLAAIIMADTLAEDVLRVLVEQRVLNPAQATDITKKMTGGATSLLAELVGTGLVDAEKFAQVSAYVRKLPYVDLRLKTITRETLAIIPESTARQHNVVAFEQSEQELHVAMADPDDHQIIEFIRKKVNKIVEVSVASAAAIKEAIHLYQDSLATEFDAIIAESKVAAATDDLSRVAEELPIIRITDSILKHAIVQDASDIHIEPLEANVVVRYRVDGILHDELTLSRQIYAGLVARLKVLSNLKIDEHRLPQDGRFKIESEDYKIAFRVSILPVYDGEKIVMRLLDESGRGHDLDSIGMNKEMLAMFRRNIQQPHGMILVTGPTGSGKTTTLYAAMKELNTADVNISTIEDPIEYRMPRINQTQVHAKIGLTFSNGLRSLVRQDPDIIMVGEIRDQETASLAVNAALTGHLVLSTLHTNSAAGAIPRLLDMKVEAFLVSSTANLLLAQRLVRRLCEDCRRASTLSSEQITALGKTVNLDGILATLQREEAVAKNTTWQELALFEAVGCRLCHEGYHGRIGIYEMIELTDTIRPLISASTSSQALEEAARREQNMVTMLEDGFAKAVAGLTSIEEVLRVAKE